MIRFQSVLGRYEASEFSQAEAAELLSVSERSFRRWSQRYDEAGEAWLLDGRLGLGSGRLLSHSACTSSGTRPFSALIYLAAAFINSR